VDLVSSLAGNRVQNFPCFLLHQKKRRRRKRAKNHPGDTVGSNTHHLALKMAGNWRLYCSPDVKKETKRFVGVSGLHFEILPRERRVLLLKRMSYLLKVLRFVFHDATTITTTFTTRDEESCRRGRRGDEHVYEHILVLFEFWSQKV